MESSNIILPESLSLSAAARQGKQESSVSSPVFQAASGEEELFDIGLEKVVDNLEKKLITYALEKTNNSKIQAADLLQISFRSLRYKIKKYGIE
jgi:two-component system response regulator PilR (NtrC family)